MEKQRLAWVKDVMVFGWFTALNITLDCMGISGGVGFNWGQAGIAWLWVFAFPYSAALHFGWDSHVIVLLFFLNPFLYALMWWGIWRSVKLFRSKPAE